MIIYLIRHTRLNIDAGICYGQTDVDVAETFLADAELISNTIAGIQFDKIYSSPLKRCKKLAEHLFQQEIIFDDRLKEMDFGDWEMQKWDNINDSYAKKWMNDFVNTPCPNGESFINLYNRTKTFLKHLPKENLEKIAIISHGGPIRSIIAFIENIPLANIFKIDIDYGSVNKVIL